MEQFKSIKICILGGEKLKPQLAKDIEKELGIVPVEGYGLTEASPVVSCNIPWLATLSDGRQIEGNRLGSTGLPLPGTAVRITNIETGQNLPRRAEGMVMVKGPQIMQGYLNNPVETARVLEGGWFRTGDLGFLDADGFLTITGRLSQFSKIGGEMVPHLGLEQKILKLAEASEQSLAVTAIPDDTRGERLVVLYTNPSLSPQEIVKRLNESDISKLWIPNAADFIFVEELPILTTGKLDLQRLKKLAQSRFALV